LHAAVYPKADDREGRVWITIDGREVANFCDYRQRVQFYRLPPEQGYEELWSQGVYSRINLYQLLEAYFSMSIDDALASDAMPVRALAMTDRRLGKRRLKAMTVGDDEHPLVQRLYRLRCEAEGIRHA
jgi:hypothetical protein